MPDATSSYGALIEPLRKLDSLLTIACKVYLEAGEIPPGVLDDFREVRKQVERAFVANFDGVADELQRDMRAFLLSTRDIDTARFGQHIEKLMRLGRAMLHALMIHNAPKLSIDDLLGPESAPKPKRKSAPVPKVPPTRKAPVMIAAGAIAVVGAVALVAAWATGMLAPSRPLQNTVASSNDPAATPANDAVNAPPANPKAAGYPDKLDYYQLERTVNLLEVQTQSLLPDELPGAMLGLEELISILEPARLRATPDQTRQTLRAFAESVIKALPEWREKGKPFFETFVGHTQKRMILALYDSSPNTVLLSDVLYASGANQQSLCVALQVLALSARCPIGLYAPNGIERPVLGVMRGDELVTFNGAGFGQRGGAVSTARTAELVAALADRLRPGLTKPEARVLCVAIIHRQLGALTLDQARAALLDIDPLWFETPAETAAPEAALRHRVAVYLQPVLCPQLLADVPDGTAVEALALYRIASAARDDAAAKQAVILLGQRAQRGAMIDGQPLALRVGDLFREQGKTPDAVQWYRRALVDHPDDARPALRLAALVLAERAAMLREAYARGERTPAFLLELATALAKVGDNLGSLAMLDDLCAREASAANFERAAVACLALERPDWAQARIQKYAGEASAALQRLDLICELQQKGLSERARALAKAWRESGNKDEFVEGLLKKYGG